MSTLEYWKTWKERCALALCSAETRKAMQAFAYSRFFRFASLYSKTTNAGGSRSLTPDPAQAWHHFESWLCLRETREGKSYKEWLFARDSVRGNPTLDSVQGGATLLMRDIVREFIRREFSARWMTALDAPIGSTDERTLCSLGELLPGSADTSSAVGLRELESIADVEASEAVDTLGPRERIALLAREYRLPLSHPAVLSVARCGKSAMNSAYHSALISIAEFTRSRYASEDRETQALLTIMVFERVKTSIVSWGESENMHARLSVLAGEGSGKQARRSAGARDRRKEVAGVA